MNVHTYRTAGGKDLIREFLDSLSKRESAEGYHILEILENGDVSDLAKLNIKHFQDKVWEIKFWKHNRMFYIMNDEENIYLLHGCKKQKNAAEKIDKTLAIKRAKELLK